MQLHTAMQQLCTYQVLQSFMKLDPAATIFPLNVEHAVQNKYNYRAGCIQL